MAKLARAEDAVSNFAVTCNQNSLKNFVHAVWFQRFSYEGSVFFYRHVDDIVRRINKPWKRSYMKHKIRYEFLINL